MGFAIDGPMSCVSFIVLLKGGIETDKGYLPPPEFKPESTEGGR